MALRALPGELARWVVISKIEVWFNRTRERQEILADGQLIGVGTKAEHGWEGMHLQSTTTEQFARVLGVPFTYHQTDEEAI